MKKLLILIIAMGSLSVFAQRRDRSDTIDLRNGRTTLRISVNSDTHNRNLGKRVKRLERAVRDLQDMVYDLQSTSTGGVSTVVYTCTMKVDHWTQYIGEEEITRSRAIKSVMNKCKQNETFDSNCKTERVTCAEDVINQ